MNKIKELKKYRRLTNEEISQILAMNHGFYYSKSTISRWINGDIRCPESIITILSGQDLFGTTNEYLGDLFDEIYYDKRMSKIRKAEELNE